MKLFIVKRLTMAKRIYRELSQEVKDKISSGMRKYHQQMGYDEKKKINRQKSDSLKRYWESIPNKRYTDDGYSLATDKK